MKSVRPGIEGTPASHLAMSVPRHDDFVEYSWSLADDPSPEQRRLPSSVYALINTMRNEEHLTQLFHRNHLFELRLVFLCHRPAGIGSHHLIEAINIRMGQHVSL
jgi:hypothetical protein